MKLCNARMSKGYNILYIQRISKRYISQIYLLRYFLCIFWINRKIHLFILLSTINRLIQIANLCCSQLNTSIYPTNVNHKTQNSSLPLHWLSMLSMIIYVFFFYYRIKVSLFNLKQYYLSLLYLFLFTATSK